MLNILKQHLLASPIGTSFPLPPFCLMVGGVSGVGKSALAGQLAQRLGAHLETTDHLREALRTAYPAKLAQPHGEPEPGHLPYYGLCTLLRMLAALLLSLAFTLIYATIAAKVPRIERVLVPLLDFLQSLPILGFFTATTAIFLGLFRGTCSASRPPASSPSSSPRSGT